MKKLVLSIKNISFTTLFMLLISCPESKSQTAYDTLSLFPDTTTFLNEAIFIGGWTDNFAIKFYVDSSWDDYLLEKIIFLVPNGIIPHLTRNINISLGNLPEDSIIYSKLISYDTIPLFPNKAVLNIDTPVVLNSSNHFYVSGFGFFMLLSLGPTWFPILDQYRHFVGQWSEVAGASYFYLKVVVKKNFTDVEDQPEILSNFSLSQNYPNPFNPSTTISWQSPVDGWQTLTVYDLLGNQVATFVNEYKPAGSYEVEFNIAHESFRATASGVYFYQLKAGDYVETKKMVLIK